MSGSESSWRKSSHSSSGDSSCLEVRLDKAELTTHTQSSRVRVRDSKAPDGNHAVIQPEPWRRFVSFVKHR